jgi:hypothetical protein
VFPDEFLNGVEVRHHARKTFREEYLTLLKKYEVPHDERYIFRPVDEE